MARLHVSVTDARGRSVPARGLDSWLPRAAPSRACGSLTIALISDRSMRRLNRQYRGIDRPTDVLSFPVEPQPAGRGQRPLGDIAIATGVARRQAREQGHGIGTELRVLALHGLLHLLGYDHETDRGDMERVEERLRRRAGLAAGLIVRRNERSEWSAKAEP